MRKSGIPCRRCTGQMFFELDLMHRHIACKCFQCGNIAAYLWVEPGQPTSVELAGRVSDGTLLLKEEVA